MTPHDTETIIVGAGHAGLALSAILRERGRDHVVLERGRIGETWRTQRWDSFRLNTPNDMTALPGEGAVLLDPDAFASAPELVERLERWADRLALPVPTDTEVRAVERDGRGFRLGTSRGTVRARNVVLAAGALDVPRRPLAAAAPAPGIRALHAAEYRSAAALPDGGVLVVGAGQSGVQIAEDLLDAGRRVHLSTSRVGRLPRRHRGRDVTAWLRDIGYYDRGTQEVGPDARRAAQPQVSGTHGGHTVALQQLARDGAVLLGRLSGIEDGELAFAADLADNLRFADAAAARTRAEIDAWIARRGIDAPPAEPDPAEAPEPGLLEAESPRRLSPARAGVSTVIWATGFGADFSYLRMPVLDADGRPGHRGGVTPGPGLFVLGHPWLRTRKSGILFGAA